LTRAENINIIVAYYFLEEFFMSRVYNFSAGPSMLPEEVLKTAAAEMLEYGNSGQSVMEMSHRSKEYQAIIDEAEADLREIMNIPITILFCFYRAVRLLSLLWFP
jgi:phosphoserine aminotransferase